MRSEFSEFSYGYALTEALVDGKQHLVRPTFPTQRQERRVGYDVRLDRIANDHTKGKGDSSSEKRLPGKAIVQSHGPCRPLKDDLKNIDRWDCTKERLRNHSTPSGFSRTSV